MVPPKTRASKRLHAPGDQPVTDGLGEEDPVHVEDAARWWRKLGSPVMQPTTTMSLGLFAAWASMASARRVS
jgi:hypothetical protein